jgi:hypothetical protein
MTEPATHAKEHIYTLEHITKQFNNTYKKKEDAKRVAIALNRAFSLPGL